VVKGGLLHLVFVVDGAAHCASSAALEWKYIAAARTACNARPTACRAAYPTACPTAGTACTAAPLGSEMIAGGGTATLRLAQPILAGFCAKLPGCDR